jgi:alkanesulfonate monooxygenase SsuD/methylene tetrahydromethanopterin reductase-like flavin-dependent oxidoreductase (luciferase family)
VLDRCCEDIGRDPAEITKTRLGAVVIAPTSAEAERKVKQVTAMRNLDPERVRTTFITGDPDSVAEQVDAFMEAGLDGMLISLPDAHDIETVELAARTLAGRLGSATAV